MATQPLYSVSCSVDGNLHRAGGGGHSNVASRGGASGVGISGGFGYPSGSGGAATGPSVVPSLHEDTIGSHLKSGLAQFVALELSRTSNVKDEDALAMLSPGLTVDHSNIEESLPTRKTTTEKSNQSKIAASLSWGGSFRSAGQSNSFAGGSFSAPRQPSRGSTSISFGNENDRFTRMDESSSSGKGEQASVMSPVSASAPKVSAGPGHISLAVPSIVSRSPSIASVLAAPGVGQQSIMSIGHFAIVPTLSHSARLDAPILQYLPWLKSIPSIVQQG